jgi:preprotein translocase subunit SecF
MFSLVGKIPNIDFIGFRKYALGFSALLSVIGIVGLVTIWMGKAELGIDFAGGVMVQGHFAQPVHIDDVRSALSSQFSDAEINEVKDFSLPNAFIIKTKLPDNESESLDRANQITAIFATKFPGNTFIKDSENVIGSAVGEQLAKDARLAIMLSLLGILIYIAFRFDFRSGIAATIATLHDVLAVIGILFIFGVEFDLLIVSALLTLAGYSLTDTVVVYDRIRENLRKLRGKSQFKECINRSVNETLSRTINTSMTVLFVVILIYIGGGSLRNFAATLILGVLIGTYSSIFVASPIIYEWEQRKPARFK